MSEETKTPKTGEYWFKNDIRVLVRKPTHTGRSVTETIDGWTHHGWDFTGWHHEPRCNSFDWQEPPAEVWPKYVVKDSWATEAYIRRDSATEGTIVLRNGTENERVHKWDHDHESFIESGSWRYVTEAEALARVKPNPAQVPAVKRVPVRLWCLSGDKPDAWGSNIIVSPVQPAIFDDQPFQEILHDADGFYIER